MHVAIDARIAYYNNSGLRRYLTGLLEALAQEELASLELSILQSWKDRSVLMQNGARRRMISPPHSLLERTTLGLELARIRPDLVHSIDFYSPLSRIPLLLTVHDLYFLRCPESLDPRSYRHYREVLRYARDAAGIVCISSATKEDLVAATGIAPARVQVIYPGPPAEAFCMTPCGASDATESDASNAPITLAVGTLEPRKNYPATIRAFAQAYRRSNGALWPLVIVGRRGYRSDEVLEAIDAARHSAPVTYLGEVGEARLRSLYRRAKVLLFASRYEGFGFPLLEAMASETAVITSKSSALAEVCGDAGLLVDPEHEESIAEALFELSRDEPRRGELIERGKRRLARFSWAQSAAAHTALYREIGTASRMGSAA